MSNPSAKLLAEGFFEFKKIAGHGLCWVARCRNRSMDDRCLCHRHHMARWRQKHQQSAAYRALKDHARNRGLAFTISVDYFKGLTDSFAFFERNGNRADTLTIDRVDATKGYEPGNCRVISLASNTAKGNRERWLPEHVQALLERQREEVRAEVEDHLDDGDPF